MCGILRVPGEKQWNFYLSQNTLIFPFSLGGRASKRMRQCLGRGTFLPARAGAWHMSGISPRWPHPSAASEECVLGGTQKKLLQQVVSLSKNSPFGAREGMGAKTIPGGKLGAESSNGHRASLPLPLQRSRRVYLLIWQEPSISWKIVIFWTILS